MIDVEKVNNRLIGDKESVMTILEEAGFYKVHSRNDSYLQCGWDDESKGKSISINIYKLSATSFSKGIKGSIYNLLMKKLNKEFPEVLEWVCRTLGISINNYKASNVKTKLPFGGYFKDIKKENSDCVINDVPTFDESILEDFDYKVSIRFLRDGINEDTQIKFRIGYDSFTGRITIPWRNCEGELIGVMGRLNREIKDGENKYFPILSFYKSQTLYGLYENFNNILNYGDLYILEAEKGTMQLDSMNINVGVSVGCSDIGDVQADIIKSLDCKRIIIMFDEGSDVEHVKEQALKLKNNNPFFKNEVGYIYDKDNKYLPKGSKCSPTDLGKEIFEKLLKECVVWI